MGGARFDIDFPEGALEYHGCPGVAKWLRLMMGSWVLFTVLGSWGVFIYYYKGGWWNFWVQLTTWGMVTNFVYFALATMSGFATNERNERLRKPTAIMLMVGFSLEMVVAAMFWVALWPTMSYPIFIQLFATINEHATCPLLILIDFILGRVPMRGAYIGVVVAVAIVYMIVNCIVTLVDVPVYSILTWKDAATYEYAAAAAVICGIVSTFAWAIRRCQRPAKKEDQLARTEDALETALAA